MKMFMRKNRNWNLIVKIFVNNKEICGDFDMDIVLLEV